MSTQVTNESALEPFESLSDALTGIAADAHHAYSLVEVLKDVLDLMHTDGSPEEIGQAQDKIWAQARALSEAMQGVENAAGEAMVKLGRHSDALKGMLESGEDAHAVARSAVERAARRTKSR